MRHRLSPNAVQRARGFGLHEHVASVRGWQAHDAVTHRQARQALH